ncbi:MAG: acetolactate decarboxylase [Armatimonadia bacterium]
MRLLMPVLLVALLVAAGGFAAVDRDVLYQASTLDALLYGVFDRAISAGELAQHGDTGIGCFEAVDGEMMMVDGQMYQIKADGTVHRARPRMGLPFACVSYFDCDARAEVQGVDLTGLLAKVDTLLPTRNIYYMFRVEGEFEHVKTRSVPRQHKPYPKLLDVAAKQPTFEFANTRGTLVGLYCPYFAAGANMVGYHFHFLNEGRTGGGHLLNCRLKKGTLQIDYTPRYLMSLPEGAYREAKLDKADKEGAEKVEKDK